MEQDAFVKIRQAAHSFKASIGLSAGMYMYSYGAIIYEGIARNLPAAASNYTWFGLQLTPLQWAGLIFSAGVLLEALLEVPTGVLADALGRKFSSLASLWFRVFFFIGLLVVYWAGHYASAKWVIISALTTMLLFAFHYTFMSGSLQAWMKDKLDEKALTNQFDDLLASSHSVYWTFFLFGSVAGLSLWLSGYTWIAYILGVASCLRAIWVCTRCMDENTGYQFVELKRLTPIKLLVALKQSVAIWQRGVKTLSTSPELWIIFLASAAVLSVSYLIEFVWPVFSRTRYGQTLGNGFSPEWIGLLLIFTVTSAAGAHFYTQWTRRSHAMSLNRLALVNCGLNLLYIVPILVATRYDQNQQLSLVAFMALMGGHKLIEGALRAPMESLQNAAIAAGTLERSTILSLGAMFKNLVITTLVFVGIGKEAVSLQSWSLPALTVVFCSILLILVAYRRT